MVKKALKNAAGVGIWQSLMIWFTLHQIPDWQGITQL